MLYCLLRFLHRVSSEEPNYTPPNKTSQHLSRNYFQKFNHRPVLTGFLFYKKLQQPSSTIHTYKKIQNKGRLKEYFRRPIEVSIFIFLVGELFFHSFASLLHFYGQWHSLSDPELEHSLITRIDFNLFCRFDELSIPDYITLCRYRNWLAQDDTLSELLKLINCQLAEKKPKSRESIRRRR